MNKLLIPELSQTNFSHMNKDFKKHFQVKLQIKPSFFSSRFKKNVPSSMAPEVCSNHSPKLKIDEVRKCFNKNKYMNVEQKLRCFSNSEVSHQISLSLSTYDNHKKEIMEYNQRKNSIKETASFKSSFKKVQPRQLTFEQKTYVMPHIKKSYIDILKKKIVNSAVKNPKVSTSNFLQNQKSVYFKQTNAFPQKIKETLYMPRIQEAIKDHDFKKFEIFLNAFPLALVFQDREGNTILHLCVINDFEEGVRVLIEKYKIDTKKVNDSKMNVIELANKLNKKNMLKVI